MTPESLEELQRLLLTRQPKSPDVGSITPLSPYEAIQAQRSQLSSDPVIANLQRFGRSVVGLLTPETPLDYLTMGTPLGKVTKAKSISFDTFKKMASKGKVQKAKSQKESLKSITEKKVPAQDFEFDDYNEMYESGDFTKKLKKAGRFVIDDMMGKVIAGRTKKDAENLLKAKTPIDFGKSYGYNDSDIAKFYVARNQGDYKNAYKDYLKDLKK